MTEFMQEMVSDPTQDQDKSGNTSNFTRTQSNVAVWFSKRFLVIILMFFGYFFGVIVKVCINIAIIEMTTNKTLNNGHETIIEPAEYTWDMKTIGMVLSTHSYGFLFSPVGGHLAIKFGGSVTFGTTTLLMAVLTALNPVALHINYYPFIACRILTGLFDGFAYASSAEIFSRWVPARERSTFMAIVFSGIYIGIAIAYPICGYVGYHWGWRMIFYMAGGSTFIWSVIWLIVVKNDPSKDTMISEQELLYIRSETETTPRDEIVHPYKKILTSPPVWALGMGKMTFGWGFSLIITCLPLYVKDITHKNVDEVGLISSVPNIVCIFMTPVAGVIMDYLQNNTKLRASQIHKIMMTFGYTTSCVLFAVAAFSSNFVVTMICFILIKIFLSFNYLILQLVCLYLAPKHSSVLLGFSAFWYVLSNIALPAVVGFMVVNHSPQEWSTCFLLSSGILVFGAIVYLVYGSSELQPWAISSPK